MTVLIEKADAKYKGTIFSVSAHHPWRRFFARNLDLIVITGPAAIIITLALYLIFPDDGLVDRILEYEMFLLIAAYLVWIPIEAGFLAATGTTPAKWIFGIRVQSMSGGNLTYANALKRAALVFVIGEIFSAIPLTTILGRIVAYFRLKKTGTTAWDKSAKSIVSHSIWGFSRWAVCVASYLIVFGLALYFLYPTEPL